MNCTPKVFCLTFGVQFILTQPHESLKKLSDDNFNYFIPTLKNIDS